MYRNHRRRYLLIICFDKRSMRYRYTFPISSKVYQNVGRFGIRWIYAALRIISWIKRTNRGIKAEDLNRQLPLLIVQLYNKWAQANLCYRGFAKPKIVERKKRYPTIYNWINTGRNTKWYRKWDMLDQTWWSYGSDAILMPRWPPWWFMGTISIETIFFYNK